MKIALAPDLHCFYTTYDKLDENGLSLRKKEWMNATASFFKTCKKEHVDTVVVPGDFFVTPKPSAEAVLLVSQFFNALEQHGMTVIGIAGNHDIAGANKKSMNDVVSAIGGHPRWCASAFSTFVHGDVGFAFLPFVKAPEILAYNPDFGQQEMAEQLISIAGNLKTQLEDAGVKKTILVGHWSILGSSTSSGRAMNEMMSRTEIILPLESLVEQAWDAVLFGHIHKPQVLHKKKPFVAYSGCVKRINLGEANDKRGFYIYDTETDEYKFFKTPAIEMKVFRAEINTMEDAQALYSAIEEADLEGKLVQVKYDIGKEHVDWVDRKEIVRRITEKNPLNIVNVVPRILEAERQRDITLTESLDSTVALDKWLDNKGIPKQEKESIFALFAEYQQQLQE